jgi:hypothetical protein
MRFESCLQQSDAKDLSASLDSSKAPNGPSGRPASGARSASPLIWRAVSSLAPRLACFRGHDDGASVGAMIVGERALPGAITSHSSIK